MKRLICLGVYLAGFILIMNAPVLAQEKLTARQIMEKVDTRIIPKDLTAIMKMNLIDRKGNVRARTIKTYRMGKYKQIVWFLSPADVKGTSFLRISHKEREDDMWLYLPAFGKVRRIASHAKRGHFMGSDFTYEDLEERKLKNYKYRLLKEEKIADKACWVIQSVPKKGVRTSYSKIVSWVLKDKYIITKEEFYDKKGRLRKRKTIKLTKVKKYLIPERMIMEDLKSNHKTEIILEQIKVDTGLSKKIFHTSYMKRIH
jgi:outer membrane lipoprotein-sorting protein